MKCLKPSELQVLMKAKYIKREGTPGHYKYTYAERQGSATMAKWEEVKAVADSLHKKFPDMKIGHGELYLMADRGNPRQVLELYTSSSSIPKDVEVEIEKLGYVVSKKYISKSKRAHGYKLKVPLYKVNGRMWKKGD